MTADELRALIPTELREYVRQSKVCAWAFHNVRKNTNSCIQDRNEYLHRLQTLFAYLFYRFVYYPAGMLGTVLSIVRPGFIRASTTELADAQQLLDLLFGAISKTHMRLTTHFLEDTDYGRNYWSQLCTSRRSKIKGPQLEVDQVVDCLDLPAGALRFVWYPLAVTVPPGIWTANECPDGQVWASFAEADSPTLARFRRVSAEIVIKMAKLWSKTQLELSTHSQVGIFKEMSAGMLPSEWPSFNISGKHLQSFRPGVYTPDSIYQSLDIGLKSRALKFKIARGEADGEDSQSEDSEDETNQEPGEDQLTRDERSPSSQQSGDTDMSIGDDNLDKTIEHQIDDALAATEVVGRPVDFGSEFEETGGTGLGLQSMTEIMDMEDDCRESVVSVLEQTGDTILGHPYGAEEAEAIAAMGARAIAKYAKLRLERETIAINDAIWRLQRIVDNNQVEIEDLDNRIAEEIEKRKYFDQLTSQMTGSYSSIDEKTETLQKLTGAVMVGGDDMAKKVSWKDRVKIAQQKAQQGVGMHWKYTPKLSGKGKDVDITRSRFMTPVKSESSLFTTPTVKSAATMSDTQADRLAELPSSSLGTTAGVGDKGDCAPDVEDGLDV
jgi:hypothetical protein